MTAHRRASALLGGLSLLVGGLTVVATAPASAVPAPGSTVFVNEIHYDNAGTDSGELVEVAGPSGTDLTGWSVVLYNGDPSSLRPYGTARALSGTLPTGQGGYGTIALTYPSNGIQNGSPDAVALVDANGALRQFLSYEGSFIAASGPAAGQTSTNIGVSESGSEPVGQSLQLTGRGTTYADFTWAPPATATPGQPNTGQTFGTGDPDPDPEPTPVCGDPATAIHDIQGSGPEFDPAFGGTQSVEGVVTAVRPGLNGVFVQEEAADVDADPLTSEGIFVLLAGRPAPTEGSIARVTGTVSERFDKTQLSATEILQCGTAQAPVEAIGVGFPLAEPGDLERFEGMLVELVDELVISEYFNYDRFGEIVVGLPLEGQDRLYTPTAVVEPGDDSRALLAAYDRRTITIDDGSTQQNPVTIPHPGNGQPFSLTNRFRGGDTITGIQGVVDYAFDRYRLHPTTYGDHTVKNPRPEARPAVGGDVEVASFNVLNYFLTLDRAGSPKCGPNNTLDCRGADDANELQRQRAKLLAAISALDADVVGLMEMENSRGVEPAADLVDGLNDLMGEGTYDYIDTGVIGTDAIRLGFLYKPGTVAPVGDFDVLDSSDDPRFIDTRSRPMLTQTFDTVAGAGDSAGERFTVSVNHLKSKGSACAGDPDLGDGQGNCNLTRTEAARAIVDHLATDPTGSEDPDQLIIGDLNAYDHEDPIDALVAGGYADQVKRFGGEYAYGYVFNGLVGYLDHALANASLADQVTGTSEWHINADEPDILDYDTSFKPSAPYAPDAYRSSDHDPVLVGLALDDGAQLAVEATPQKVVVDRTRVMVHAEVTDADGLPIDGGTVTVLEDGEVLGSAAVTDGVADVRIPVFTETGAHNLTVTYSGARGVSSETTTVTVQVKRRR